MASENTVPDDSWLTPEKTLREWLLRAQNARNAHRVAGKCALRWHRRISITTAVLFALVATTLAAQLATNAVGGWVVTVAAALAAILAGALSVRKFDEQAGAHETARAGYACVCRDMEQVLSIPVAQRGDANRVMTRIRRRLDDLAHLNTPVSERIWKQTAT